VFVRDANGDGQDVPLLDSPADEFVEDWSKDGRFVAYKVGLDGEGGLYVLPLDVGGKPGKPIAIVEAV
jgi:hypothetical protein